jgi:hypothetical protein
MGAFRELQAATAPAAEHESTPAQSRATAAQSWTVPNSTLAGIWQEREHGSAGLPPGIGQGEAGRGA